MWQCAVCTTPCEDAERLCTTCGAERHGAGDKKRRFESNSPPLAPESSSFSQKASPKFGLPDSSARRKTGATQSSLSAAFTTPGRVTFGNSNPPETLGGSEETAASVFSSCQIGFGARNPDFDSLQKLEGERCDEKLLGSLLTWGSGECEQLPLRVSTLNDFNCSPKPQIIKMFSHANVSRVFCGSMSSFALVERHGKQVLYSWGCADMGVLGRPIKNVLASDEAFAKTGLAGYTATSGKVPHLVPSLPMARVANLVSGDSMTAALLDSGDVFVWGAFRDSYGNLGFRAATGEYSECCYVPSKLQLGGRVLQIAGGDNHLLMLFEDNSGPPRLCVLGSNEFGQLFLAPPVAEEAHQLSRRRETLALRTLALADLKFHVTEKGDRGSITAAQHAELLRNGRILSVHAGKCTSFVRVSLGEQQLLFGCGRNFFGELGCGDSGSASHVARRVQFERTEDVLQLVGGDFATLLLTRAGNLYVCGKGLHCGLNRSDPLSKQCVPELLEHLSGKVRSVCCGTKTFFATCFGGEVLAWGENDAYQVGDGSEGAEKLVPVVLKPQLLFSARCFDVAAGAQHTVALVDKDLSALLESTTAKANCVAGSVGNAPGFSANPSQCAKLGETTTTRSGSPAGPRKGLSKGLRKGPSKSSPKGEPEGSPAGAREHSLTEQLAEASSGALSASPAAALVPRTAGRAKSKALEATRVRGAAQPLQSEAAAEKQPQTVQKKQRYLARLNLPDVIEVTERKTRRRKLIPN